jgi:hypothetical protein
MKINQPANHLFVCNCGHMEHQFVVSYFGPPDDDEFVYVHVHLTPLSLWQRVKTAVWYVLGRQSPYGAFAEVLLDQQQCLQLSKILAQRAQGAGVDQHQP